MILLKDLLLFGTVLFLLFSLKILSLQLSGLFFKRLLYVMEPFKPFRPNLVPKSIF